jgi:two-component system cell cycle sensor histidine kinase/response regulator CckA
MPQNDPNGSDLSRESGLKGSAKGRGHVLIVDQETSARDFMDQVLRSAGYVTVRAMNGEEALEIAEQFGPFDLLLTDEQSPRLAGQELARRLREREPWLKVIYLTGHTDQLFEANEHLWEDEAILEKPSSGPGLLDAVSTLLAKRVPTKGS